MESQIKQDFKHKRFSRLEYLNRKESWDKDEFNLGLYYFLLESKQQPTDIAFKEIVDFKGDHASAYNYLGDVAKQLFDEKEYCDISTYFYEQALTFSDRNEHSHWGLFRTTRDPLHFFKSIVIDYEDGEFQRISNKMHHLYAVYLIENSFSQEEWIHLKSICLDNRIDCPKDILLVCHFHLKEFEDGVSLLKSESNVYTEIAQLYLDNCHIDKETFLSTISYYERLKFIDDASLAYDEVKREAKKDKTNPTQEVIIRYAFEAKAYNDVIELVERHLKKDKHHFYPNLLKLYHTLSALYLGLPLNEDFERDINSMNYFGDTRIENDKQSLPLYLAYLILKNINKLESMLEKRDSLHEITGYALYKDIQHNLGHESLLGHYLYEPLVDGLKELKKQWRTKEIEGRLKHEELDPEELASLLIDKGEDQEALSVLSDLEPSMSVSNMRGVCFEHTNDWDSALKHYKLALDVMLANNEKNNIIISNYLYCLHRTGSCSSIDSNLYEEYLELFNLTLAESFKYSRFVYENGQSLFKYYPFNKFTLDAVMNGYFYLAPADQLNDPIELPYENLTKDQELVFLRPNFRLSSFSNNENSMLMWSHYAEEHSGLMIEYCFEGALPNGVGIEKVQYPHVAERFLKKDKYIFNQYMLTKNKDWAYEKEVRLFGYNRDKVYYEARTYPKRTNNAAAYIKSITVGYKFPESTIKLIQSIVSTLNESRNKTLPQIALRRAKLSENNFFDLEYEEIR